MECPFGEHNPEGNMKNSPSFPLAKTEKFSSSHPSPIRNFSTTFTGFGQLSFPATLQMLRYFPHLTKAGSTCETGLVSTGIFFFLVLSTSKLRWGIFCFLPPVQASLRKYVTSRYSPALVAIHLPLHRLSCNMGDTCVSIPL